MDRSGKGWILLAPVGLSAHRKVAMSTSDTAAAGQKISLHRPFDQTPIWADWTTLQSTPVTAMQ
jgi:hypothetical protein